MLKYLAAKGLIFYFSYISCNAGLVPVILIDRRQAWHLSSSRLFSYLEMIHFGYRFRVFQSLQDISGV